MDLGRIIQSGPPEELYNRPADSFVAQYLGPANLLSGQVEAIDSRGEPVVRTPIGRLVGQSTGGPLRQGALVTVAIRPEAISLAAHAPPDANRFLATLERQTFLGELRQVHLVAPGAQPMLALVIQDPNDPLRTGQSLTAAVPAHRVVVMPNRHRMEGTA
jgi:ABC-type Fe3+/spermidine/putrescine transport system ATPase subunit